MPRHCYLASQSVTLNHMSVHKDWNL